MDSTSVCLALQTKYVCVNIETAKQTELFPYDRDNDRPFVKRVESVSCIWTCLVFNLIWTLPVLLYKFMFMQWEQLKNVTLYAVGRVLLGWSQWFGNVCGFFWNFPTSSNTTSEWDFLIGFFTSVLDSFKWGVYICTQVSSSCLCLYTSK